MLEDVSHMTVEASHTKLAELVATRQRHWKELILSPKFKGNLVII